MIEINIKEDKMSAEIKITPEPEETIGMEYIKEMLELEGIQAGINEQALRDVVENKVYDRYVTIASGKEAVNGVDGYYDYYFITEEESRFPRILEDGSVDYSMAFTNVVEGDLVAQYHPRTTGTYGYNVMAAVLPPKMGKELRPLGRKGVRLEENNYYAEKNGLVTMRGSQLLVLEILDIKGDVDQTVGNLEFNGDIHVHGSILSNLSVKAEGSVIVDGVIESANIKAERNVFVAKGVHGQGVGRIEADGNVCATFIDHSIVSAGQDIKIDYAIGSILEAQGMVIAEGNYSSIAGGIVTAVHGVEAGILGNTAQISTHIYAGINSRMRRELSDLKTKVQELKDDSELIEDDEEFQSQLDTIEEMRSKILELEAKHRECRTAPIMVHEAIHIGAKCYLSEAEAPNLLGRKNFELRNIRYRVVCKKIGTYSPEDIGRAEAFNIEAEEYKARPKILIIDDDSKMIHLLSEMLQDNYQVFAARSGKSAEKLLKNKKMELILLSYMLMSEESGVQILRSLQRKEVVKDVPVVFLIGMEDKGNIIECLELKPEGYVAKPVEYDVLIKTVREILGTE